MGMYKYGMYVKTIAKIKTDIISRKLTDSKIQEKYGISVGQIGFIHDKLLKGEYKNMEKRISDIESKLEIQTQPVVGSILYCNVMGYGTGEVKKIFVDSELMLVKFTDRQHETMCNLKKMITVHDETKRKLTVIKV